MDDLDAPEKMIPLPTTTESVQWWFMHEHWLDCVPMVVAWWRYQRYYQLFKTSFIHNHHQQRKRQILTLVMLTYFAGHKFPSNWPNQDDSLKRGGSACHKVDKSNNSIMPNQSAKVGQLGGALTAVSKHESPNGAYISGDMKRWKMVPPVELKEDSSIK